MKKIISLIKMSIIQCLEYRGDLLIFSFAYAVQPVIYLLVWLAVSTSSPSLPMTSGEFTRYYIGLLIVQLWVSAWASQIISFEIRHGRISPYLLKPFPYINYFLSSNLGEKLIKTIMTLPLVIILVIILKPQWPSLSVLNWVIFIWTWVMAGIVYFLIDTCVGCLAFWFEETSAIDDLYNITHSIFSGILIPLILMPEFIRNLATFLPFRYSLSFPMEILLGKLNSTEELMGIIIQIVFVILLWYLYQQLWTRGIRKYSAVGN